jgi:hypothetical protein
MRPTYHLPAPCPPPAPTPPAPPPFSPVLPLPCTPPASLGACTPPPGAGGGTVAVVEVVELVVGALKVLVVELLVVVLLVEGVVVVCVELLLEVVVLVVSVAVVVVEIDSGCPHSTRAREERLAIPLLSASRKPGSTVEGSARKSCSVFTIASCVGVQFPLPAFAACATASKSPFNGPALAEGISPPPLLPHEAANATVAAPSTVAAKGRAVPQAVRIWRARRRDGDGKGNMRCIMVQDAR